MQIATHSPLSFPRAFLAVALLLIAGPAAVAQGLADQLWSDVAEASISSTAERQIVPSAYRTVRLNGAAMADVLAEAPLEATPLSTRGGVVLPLPTPDGGFASFRVVEAPVMAPELQARYPQIRSYLGRGIDAPGTLARISSTPDGFRALVLGAGGTMLIDPFQPGDTEHYSVYYKRDYVPELARVLDAFEEEQVLDELGAEPIDPEARLPDNGEQLRTYRLALAATGEYTTFHGGTVTEGLAAQVVAMTRVNGVYERDLSVRMELVPDNDTLVYTNSATDPYTNNDPGALLSQNQSNLDAVIGPANYDIGHVFSTGGGGLASLGVVCVNGAKARGETGLNAPIGDIFYIDYVAHEMGHQFRGNHSFNGSAGNCAGGNRNPSTAYEPGSGSTIMAYAGICGSHNLQSRSDDYFHTVSLIEIVNFISFGSGSTCAEVEETENEPPEVTASNDGVAIPIETPFVLSGSATDDGGAEALTLVWEEFDLGPAGPPAGVTPWNGTPPFFRSFEPVEDSVRYFPGLDRLLDGLSPVRGEGLPIDDQTLRFRLTARDNVGGIGDVQIQIDVVEEAGPFVVTFANEDSLVYRAGSEQEITWDVAGTDEGEVNTPTVDILLSTDNGETFALLSEATDNDGAETVTFPEVTTEEARIMIRAVDNVFFDVNDEPFELDPAFVANEAQPSASYALSAVYPNPFGVASARATLNLTVERSQTVRVSVYDALGRRVAVLHEGPLAAGQNRQFALDASKLAGGTYFVRVAGETFADVRPMTVVR